MNEKQMFTSPSQVIAMCLITSLPFIFLRHTPWLRLSNIKYQGIWHLLWYLLSPDMEDFLIKLFISFTYNSSYRCMCKYIIVRPGLGTGCSVWQTGLEDTATASAQINNWWLLVIWKMSGAQGLPELPASLFTLTTALAWLRAAPPIISNWFRAICPLLSPTSHRMNCESFFCVISGNGPGSQKVHGSLSQTPCLCRAPADGSWDPPCRGEAEGWSDFDALITLFWDRTSLNTMGNFNKVNFPAVHFWIM